MKSLIILGILAVASLAISIPVTSQTDKCMVVYATNAEDYLKIDIKF